MDVVTVIMWIVLGIVCAVIHKNKGYSPIAGFCWGFFLSIIGLIVVLLEKDKEEMANKNGLSTGKWLGIFLGVGSVLLIIFFVVSYVVLNNL